MSTAAEQIQPGSAESACEKNPALLEAYRILAMASKTGVPSPVDQHTRFCIERENGRVFADWDEETVRLMLAYHFVKGTLSVYNAPQGGIGGILMWYRCNHEDDWFFVQHWTPDRPAGDAIFIAYCFAALPGALKHLTMDLIWREPDVLTKRLVSVRHRGGCPQRVEWTPRIFNKILKAKG